MMATHKAQQLVPSGTFRLPAGRSELVATKAFTGERGEEEVEDKCVTVVLLSAKEIKYRAKENRTR